MEQPSYDATASPTYTEFEFDSNGTNGVTKNVIKFTPIANSGQPIHNLGFGIKVGDAIDDKTTINNGDRDGDPSEIDQGKPEQTDHLQRLKLTT